MYPSVKSVKALANYTLLLSFDNNEVKIFDMKPYLDKGIFKKLKDEEIFKSVKISFDTIEWPNGADICPEILYDESIKVEKCA
ncbi:MAG TPA: DUF2442 domain-containing protein [Candidatus Wallbacteria bacterium]|nr:MAG: hypothetical protein BWY32_03114 [bacterium ADurb.Bin243]HOD39559.1 DUF2442 domain-containing protein [Candidatus Wallbacteria bacterium]HPG59203.1 DUF2442 domain-containing protein [Candidatus Wallbacteria bacterium]